MQSYLKKIIKYLFYLFIFLLPWQTRWIWHWGELNKGYWEYGTFSLYGTEILLLIILILIVLWGFLNLKRNLISVTPLIEKKSGYPILIGFLIFTIFSIFWADNRSLTFYYWTILLEGVFILLLVSQFRFDFKKITYALIWGGGIQAIFGIWQFFSQQIFASKWLGIAAQLPSRLGVSVIEQGHYRWLRAYGSLSHPNVLAGFLVITILILLIFILNKVDFRLSNPPIKKRLWIIVYYLLLAVCLFCLGLTFSRGAWLALIIGLIVLIWQEKRISRNSRRLEKELIVIVLITVVIFSILFWPLILSRFQTTERLEIKSAQERLTSYQESIVLIKKHPLIGVGLGNYTQAIWQEIDSKRPSWTYQPVHNFYLLIWAELGSIGLILFLLLIIWLLKTANYLLPLAASLLAIGFFDHYLWSLYFGIIFFWLILGITQNKAVDNQDLTAL